MAAAPVGCVGRDQPAERVVGVGCGASGAVGATDAATLGVVGRCLGGVVGIGGRDQPALIVS